MIACLVSVALITAYCGPSSKKGAWIEADLQKFSSECTGIKEMKDLGELGQKVCECALSRSVAEFDSYSAANSSEAGMKGIFEACAKEAAPAPSP